MSASQQKKNRQEQTDAAVNPKQERAAQAKKDARKLKILTISFSAVLVVLLLVVIIGGVTSTGVIERNSTAVILGDHKLTAVEVKYFYNDCVNTFAQNNSNYLSYFLDTSKPLNEQKYDDTKTWADYFMDTALTNARNTYAVYDEAVSKGITLSEDDQKTIESNLSMLKLYASMRGYSSVNKYIAAMYGRGCNEASYRKYMEVCQLASSYDTQFRNSLTYTDQQLRDKEAEDFDAYSDYTYRMYQVKLTDYADSSAEDKDAANAAGREKAKAVAEEIKSDTTNETTFIQSVKTHCTEKEQDTYATNDDATLSQNVRRANLPSSIQEWVSDSSRKAGDVAVLPVGDEGSETGFIVVYYLSKRDNSETKMVNVRHILIETSDTVTMEQAREKIEEIKASYEENPTEENFASLASSKSEDSGSKNNGGLYENVYEGAMVKEFNDWIFDPARKEGDVGIVETKYGCHLIYFVSKGEQSYRDYLITQALISDDYNAWFTGLTDNYTETRKGGLRWVNTALTLQTSSN